MEVVRPDIAGLMGAFGAALHGMTLAKPGQVSTPAEKGGAAALYPGNKKHAMRRLHQPLPAHGERLPGRAAADQRQPVRKAGDRQGRRGGLNLYRFKQELLAGISPPRQRGTIGIPLCLNMYELLPFWHAFFTSLGFAVVTSPASTRKLYPQGRPAFPATRCASPASWPTGTSGRWLKWVWTRFFTSARLQPGRAAGRQPLQLPGGGLLPRGAGGQLPGVCAAALYQRFCGPAPPRRFLKRRCRPFGKILPRHFKAGGGPRGRLPMPSTRPHAAPAGQRGAEIIEKAQAAGKRIIVLAGRPYHVDPEVNHGIDALICRHGAAVVTEDSVAWAHGKISDHGAEPVDLSLAAVRRGEIAPPSLTWTWCSW